MLSRTCPTAQACQANLCVGAAGYRARVQRFTDPMPALPLVSALVREERLAQAAHAEALDAKAGVLLGFSGVLVVLTTARPDFLSSLGRVAAACAAGLSLWAFVPRRLPVPDTRAARNLLFIRDADAAALRLVDAEIRMIGFGRELVSRKSMRIKLSMGFLVLAIGLTVLAQVLK